MVLPNKGRKRRACCKPTQCFCCLGKLLCQEGERSTHRIRRPTCSVVWLISVQQLANIDKTSTCCTEGKTTKRERRVVVITALLADGGDGGRSPLQRQQKAWSSIIFLFFYGSRVHLILVCTGRSVWVVGTLPLLQVHTVGVYLFIQPYGPNPGTHDSFSVLVHLFI